MRVFVTGGTGFVGAPVVRRLLERGHDVHALVVETDPRPIAAGARAVTGDLLHPESFAAALDTLRPEACVHLGWYAHPADYLSHRVNVDLVGATAKLGAMLVDVGCKRLVGVGTCFEYDTAFGYLSEATTPLRPQHMYSTCKRAAHDILAHLTAGTGTELTWARLFYLYGPNESRGRLVPAVIEALVDGGTARVSTGEQIRDFMHVDDAAAGLVGVLESSLTGPVNVASGRPIAVRDVVATIARALDAEDRVAWGAVAQRPNDPPFICADIARLKRTGFAPRHDLESGLRETIACYKR